MDGDQRGRTDRERLHDREEMSAREGMADTSDGALERGERQARTGGGADRVDADAAGESDAGTR